MFLVRSLLILLAIELVPRISDKIRYLLGSNKLEPDFFLLPLLI